ncbi:MAG: transketolase [Casimicrobiaceae bacterium]|nr:transketolase [Casimicrobiaceae bacterium]MCX8097806.1 transketolase [Casimicrobiaceae bacterium]MDW8312656.1 transketolase [Burkholderiales bacterium]
MEATQSTMSELAAAAWRIRRYAVRMAALQGQGYVGQALGWADVLAVLYRRVLRYDPRDPKWPYRDRLLLSHGHYAIALYAALIEAGILPEEEWTTYGADDSRLPMSGMATYTPGMEISGGSLGQGLAIGVGMALALRHRQIDARVVVSMSDGELDEGAVWEAAMSAAHHRLQRLIAVVDINNQQADAPARAVMDFEPLIEKWQAFGWWVRRANGNDLAAVVEAFDAALAHPAPVPRALLFDTVMGRGVPFLEAREKTHFIRVEPDEWERALAALDASCPQGVPA